MNLLELNLLVEVSQPTLKLFYGTDLIEILKFIFSSA